MKDQYMKTYIVQNAYLNKVPFWLRRVQEIVCGLVRMNFVDKTFVLV